jgi:hypothetical protein
MVMNEVTTMRIRNTSIRIPAQSRASLLEVDSANKDTKIRMHGDSGQSCHTVKGIELMAPDTREDVVQLDVDRAAAAAKKGHPRVQ